MDVIRFEIGKSITLSKNQGKHKSLGRNTFHQYKDVVEETQLRK